MFKNGYTIIVYGEVHQTNITFSEKEPTEDELKELIKKYNGIRAYITPSREYVLSTK